MVKNAEVDYEYENDVLYLYSGDKVNDSLQIENFVIDFSHENRIVGVEIIDASKILSKLLQMDIARESLQKIESAGISVYQGRELLYILLVRFTANHQSIGLRIPVPVPVSVTA